MGTGSMEKGAMMKSFSLMVFLVMFFIMATVQTSVSEMTLNDNVNIEGDIFLNGTGGGINFPDGSEQTTAAKTSWSKILTTDRFELVMENNEAVLDRETGLVWQRVATNVKYNWDVAQSVCYNLEIGGRKGWRLPTLAELSTLVEPANDDPALPANHPFTISGFVLVGPGNGLADNFWTSTPYSGLTGFAWHIYFYNGKAFSHKIDNEYYIRAVRSAE